MIKIGFLVNLDLSFTSIDFIIFPFKHCLGVLELCSLLDRDFLQLVVAKKSDGAEHGGCSCSCSWSHAACVDPVLGWCQAG